jgi:hypothetical protein
MLLLLLLLLRPPILLALWKGLTNRVFFLNMRGNGHKQVVWKHQRLSASLLMHQPNLLSTLNTHLHIRSKEIRNRSGGSRSRGNHNIDMHFVHSIMSTMPTNLEISQVPVITMGP